MSLDLESDEPPPLEDCTELLERRKQSLSTQPILNSSKECKDAQKSKKSGKNKAAFGFNSGFLLNSKSSKKTKNKKSKKEKSKSKINRESLKSMEASIESKSNGPNDAFIVPEAQNFLKGTKQWKTAEMTQKLHANKKVWNSMLSPEFGTAMQEMSENPKAALEKYKNDPNILPTLQSVIETMTNQSLSSITNQISTEMKKQKQSQTLLSEVSSKHL